MRNVVYVRPFKDEWKYEGLQNEQLCGSYNVEMNPSSIKHRFINLALLLGTLLFIFSIDRFLLTTGLARWESDPVLHYKHRPGKIFNWGREYDNKPIYINRHGFHDDEFPEEKAVGELRGLIIGDSIVMGHGVTAAEAFANQLEKMLSDSLSGYDTYQVINAGVQGYSTFQYLEILKRTFKLLPDFIVIGFCMNDVTEPYRINRSYGGSGVDYHGILQVSRPWLDYLVNKTGFGRLANYIKWRIKAKWPSSEELARAETYNVRRMAEHSSTDPVYVEAWKHILSDLSKIYELARNGGIPVALIIFPHTFQLGHEELQEPQRILAQHAAQHGVSCLDMTDVAEKLTADGVPLADLFLDSDHYTVEGHRVVANALLRHLESNGVF